MKQAGKRITSLLAAGALLVALVPGTIWAAGSESETGPSTSINEAQSDSLPAGDMAGADSGNLPEGSPSGGSGETTTSESNPDEPEEPETETPGAPVAGNEAPPDTTGNGQQGTGDAPATGEGAAEPIEIIGFAPLDEAVRVQGFDLGSATLADIVLPGTLQASGADDAPLVVQGVAWECTSPASGFDAGADGLYLFTPQVPEEYTLADGAELPEIRVILRPAGPAFMPVASTASEIDLTDSDADLQQAGVNSNGAWSFTSGTQTVTIHDGADVTITGAAQTRRVVVEGNATVTLAGVDIDVSDTSGAAPLLLENGANLTLVLADDSENTLKSGPERAGLQASAGTTLRIEGSGKLKATGGSNSAGIGGGGSSVAGGSITISGGIVEAYGGAGGSSGGAGIGNGSHDAGGSSGGPGIGGHYASTITIGGNAQVTATGGRKCVGIGGGNNIGVSVTIEGNAQVMAAGGEGGAGIGSGWGGVYVNITITGGIVEAYGGTLNGRGGAGIGGGASGEGSAITITGGTVTATGANGGQDIGSGEGNTTGGTLTIENGADLILSANGTNADLTIGECTIQGAGAKDKNGDSIAGAYSWLTVTGGTALPDGEANWPDTWQQDTSSTPGRQIVCSGTLVVLAADIQPAQGQRVFWKVVDGSASIQDGKFTMPGQPVSLQAALETMSSNNLINLAENEADFIQAAASASHWSYNNGAKSVSIHNGADVTITGETSTRRVVVEGNAAVTLDGVDIDMSGTNGAAALMLENGADLTLVLADDSENTLKSGWDCAGLQAPEGTTLTIQGSGKLKATGGTGGAGIGGNSGGAGGTITITGGIVEAYGKDDVSGGAGIGGGNRGAGGTIKIGGDAQVMAVGDYKSAGIGGSNGGAGGSIIIEGDAVVKAVGGDNGAGIGGGHSGAGGNITIKGNAEVEATGGHSSAGIGGGLQGAGGAVNIEGNADVTAASGAHGAGIGGGAGGAGGAVTITGGTVTATGGPGKSSGGAGIGGGFMGAGGTVTITGGTVTAMGGEDGGQDIGSGYSNTTGGSLQVENATLHLRTGRLNQAQANLDLTSCTLHYGSRDGLTLTFGPTRNIPTHANINVEAMDAGDGSTAEYSNGQITLLRETGSTFTGYTLTGSTGTNRVAVKENIETTATLDGVNIDVSGIRNTAALRLENGADLTLVLADGSENKLESGWSCAGLQAQDGTTLTIQGNGELTAMGGASGAGIGGGEGGAGGNITIAGGTVVAYGSNNSGYTASYGAGIGGGGYYGAGGDITIIGGKVEAYGGSGILGNGGSAGIGGGGYYGAGGSINIGGNAEVKAWGGMSGAGIGGGYRGANGSVNIGGNAKVMAWGGMYGAGIGGGYNGAGGTIKLGGNADVTSTGGNWAAGIGGGNSGAGGTVTITGGTVTATGTDGGSDIGSGYGNTTGGSLTIERGANLTLAANGTNAALSIGQCTIQGAGATDKDGGNIAGTYSWLTVPGATAAPLEGSWNSAWQTISESQSESQVVRSGTGVQLVANAPLNQYLARWNVTVGSVALTGNTFTMPTHNLTVAAEYESLTVSAIGDTTVQVFEPVNLTLTGLDAMEYTVKDSLPYWLTLAGGSISGRAQQVGSFTFTIVATHQDGANFGTAELPVTLSVGKSTTPPTITWPDAAPITHGQSLTASALTGGSTNGSFAWQDDTITPTTVGSQSYAVVFTPSDTDLYDYTGVTLTKEIEILVHKAAQTAPAAPTLQTATATSITLAAESGLEYRLGSGDWQTTTGTSITFQNLVPNMVYSFQARRAETATHEASPASAAASHSTGKAALTGSVAVTGAHTFGETLGVDATGLATNPSGYVGALEYQWLRNGSDIPGANGSAYTPVQADIGQAINVRVSSPANSGSVESTNSTPVDKAAQPAPASIPLAREGNIDTGVLLTVGPVPGAEYSFDDGAAYSDTNTHQYAPGTATATVYVRIKETATHHASAPARVETSFARQDQPAPDAFALEYELQADGSYTVTIPAGRGSEEYSFDGLAYGTENKLEGAAQGSTVTGYKRHPQTDLYNASPAQSASVTLPVLVAGIEVRGENGAASIESQYGSLQLYAVVSPTNASEQGVVWSITGGGELAAISGTGLLTAKADGTVTVRATAQDGSGVYGELAVTVKNQADLCFTAPLPAEIRVGDSFTLTPSEDTRTGGNGWDWDCEYFSATFNSPATFTALKAGSSTITYTAEDGRSLRIEVTVLAAQDTGSGAEPGVVKGTGDSGTHWVYMAAAILAAFGIFAACLYKRRTTKIHRHHQEDGQ